MCNKLYWLVTGQNTRENSEVILFFRENTWWWTGILTCYWLLLPIEYIRTFLKRQLGWRNLQEQIRKGLHTTIHSYACYENRAHGHICPQHKYLCYRDQPYSVPYTDLLHNHSDLFLRICFRQDIWNLITRISNICSPVIVSETYFLWLLRR